LFRQRWALFAAFALVIFFGAALFLPPVSSSKKKAQSVLAMNNLKQLSEPTNPELPELAAADDSARAKIPAAPTIASGNAASAPVSDEVAEKTDALDKKNFKAETKLDQFASTASQNFQNHSFSAQNSFKNTAAQNKAVAVLANFQLQQNGNAIRVVDADGSVYEGTLQPEYVVAQNEPMPAAPPASAPMQVDRAQSAVRLDEAQTAQNYFFRVTGTNLTLKQNVVFAGNLLANVSATSNARQTPTGGFGGGQSQPALMNQLPWSSSRIAGTAMVSDTNSIEINAVPQPP
jgi:hypothetical protein